MQNSWLKTECDKMVATISPITSTSLQRKIIRHPKRFRSAFTTEQVNYLEGQFKKFPYISREHRKEVAAHLKINERPIKIWFQNRRMREKKDSFKECANETGINSPQEFGKDQLNNVHAAPSTNDLRPHSLLVMPTVGIIDKSKTDDLMSHKLNNTEHNVNKANKHETNSKQSVENLEKNMKPLKEGTESKYNNFHHHMLPFTLNAHIKKMSSQDNPKKNSTEQCLKYKEELPTTLPKFIDFHNDQNSRPTPKQLPLNYEAACIEEKINHLKTPKLNKTRSVPMEQPYVLTVPNDLKDAGCYTVMPTIFPSQIMSPEGIVWKPVQIMPLVTPARSQAYNLGLNKCCKCKCHESVSHGSLYQQTVQNPCPQYVYSIPFQNMNSKF